MFFFSFFFLVENQALPPPPLSGIFHNFFLNPSLKEIKTTKNEANLQKKEVNIEIKHDLKNKHDIKEEAT